jgi:hypothetical protein
MDESREDMTRIHVDSLRDWHRMKASFAKAIFDQFDQRIRQNGLESERATLLPYVQQVRIVFSTIRLHILTGYRGSLSTRPLKRRKPTYE